MKKLIYILLLSPALLFSQSLRRQVIASTGGSYLIGDVRIRSTIAQPPGSTTFSNSENFLRQGFQQPNSCNYMDEPTVDVIGADNCFDSNLFELAYSGENAAVYEFDWSFDNTASISLNNTSTVNNLSFTEAGEHIVDLEIQHGTCTETTQVTIEVDEELEIEYATENATCSGQDGEINITVNGGIPDYQYDFGDGYTPNSQTYLPQGDYTLTILDQSGCSTTETFSIVAPDSISMDIETTPEYCNQENATAEAIVSGGIEPYNYDWSNGISGTGNEIDNLNSFTDYSVLITDSNDCTINSIFTIEMINGVLGDVIATSEYCNQENGTASALGSLGEEPFTYNWSNGETTSEIENLLSNDYTLTITDVNNCSDTVSFNIDFVNGIEILNAEITHESCADTNDGEIEIELSTSDDIQLEWSNGQTDMTSINDLEPGYYSVSVNDANNCSDTQNFEIEAGYSINAEAIIDYNECIDNQGGNIELLLNGGAEPYTVYWTDSSTGSYAGSGLDININTASIYEAQITDINDCELNYSIEVISEDCEIIIPTGFSPNGDNINDLWIIQGAENIEYINVKIFNRQGQIVFEDNNYQNNWDGTDLSFGAYFYVVEFSTGQSFTGHITLKR